MNKSIDASARTARIDGLPLRAPAVVDRVDHSRALIIDDRTVPINGHRGRVNVPLYVAGQERVRHARDRCARLHLCVAADRDTQPTRATIEDIAIENRDGTQGDGEMPIVEGHRHSLAPNRHSIHRIAVDAELDVEDAAHRLLECND